MNTNINKSFRLSAKHLYLTYSQCPLQPSHVKELLFNLLDKYNIQSYLVVQEEHKQPEEGQSNTRFHLHCYFALDKTFNTYNPRYLDLIYQQELYHGNYQTARNPKNVIQYCFKHQETHHNFVASDDIIKLYQERNQLQGHIQPRMTKKASSDLLYIQMDTLAQQGLIDEAMDLLRKHQPGTYIRSHAQLEKSLLKIHLKAMGAIIKYPLDSFAIPQDFQDFLDKAKREGFPKTLQIIGPPRIGKTQFLIAYFQNLGYRIFRLNNIDGFRHYWKQNAIMYDDLNWSEPTITRAIALQMFDPNVTSTIPIKHSSVQLQPGIRIAVGNLPIESYDPCKTDNSFPGASLLTNHFAKEGDPQLCSLYKLREIRDRIDTFTLKDVLLYKTNTNTQPTETETRKVNNNT